MARRDDPRGYVGMSAHFFSGAGVAKDKSRAEACLVEAARRDHLRGILLLGEFDLGLRNEEIPDAPKAYAVPRGIALPEEVSRRGDPQGFDALARFFHLKQNEPRKREFYAREAFKMDPQAFPSELASLYQLENSPLYDPEQAACLLALEDVPKRDRVRNSALVSACPRQGGPLTRADSGLPPAPGRLDLGTLQPIYVPR